MSDLYPTPGRGPAGRLLFGAWLPAGVMVATFLAVVPLLRAYRVRGEVPFVVAGAIGSVAVAFVVIRIWRQSPWVSYMVSLAALVLLLLLGAGPHPAEIMHAIIRGPNRVLTETLPLGGPRSTVSALVVYTWICGATTAEVLLRSRDGRPNLSAGLAVPLVFYLISYAVGASAPGRDRVSGPLLLAAVIGMALARNHYLATAGHTVDAPPGDATGGRPPPRWPRVAGGAVIGVVVVVVLAISVPALPRMSHKPASLHRSAPTAAVDMTDPVDLMAALRDDNPHGPIQTLLTVDLEEPSSGYLGVAVLDSYDGLVWRFGATFDPTGGRVPSGTGSPAGSLLTAPVNQRVSIGSRLPVPLLPALDRVSSVRGLPVLADTVTGMLAPRSLTTQGAVYTVLSDAPSKTLTGISTADSIGHTAGSVGAPISAADLALPPDTAAAMTTTLRFLVNLTGQRPAPTVAYLQAVVDALHRKEHRIDPALPSNPASAPVGETRKAPAVIPTTVPAVAGVGGTSLSEAINGVTIGMRATPEQFATLFAMTARYLGVPARVVTGFRVAPSSSAGPVGAGSYQVTNRQAWAWAEIPIAGVGWVVVDPTPDSAVGLNSPVPEQVQSPATTIPPRQANAVPHSEPQGHALAKPATVKQTGSHPAPAWLIGLLALLATVVVLLIAGPGQAAGRRLLRRRGRRSGDPSELAVGAWLELLDGLDQAGMQPRAAATTAEVAAEAGSHFGPEVVPAISQVGALADRAVCSTNDPPDPAAAERAWTSQRDVVDALHRGLDRRMRVRALMSVGSSARRPSGLDRAE